MIAGLLVSLTLLVLLRPDGTPWQLARAVAIATLAMGLGGTMTYGQTVGLTHDGELIGHAAAWRWGMLGLAIKGGVWIGLAGAFLGLGLGGVRYRPGEMALLMVGLVGVFFVGTFLINSPFDPANKVLPTLYFSDHWHWEPDKVDMKPRPETWGGLWSVLIALVAYATVVKRDMLVWRMGFWGVLGGGLGFPIGQCVQSYRQWFPEAFQDGLLASISSHMNWWNMMETTYGAVMGAVLGLGLWLNRSRIRFGEDDPKGLPVALAGVLLIAHITLLFLVEFRAIRMVDMFYDLGLIMVIIPMVLCVGWRTYPFLQVFVVTLIPIAGKTVRQLVVRGESIPALPGWSLYLILPLGIGLVAAIWAMRLPATRDAGRQFVAGCLMITAWSYFWLNWAFFGYPWPWAEWTGRTPNGLIFTGCVIGLTVMTALHGRLLKNEAPAGAPR